MVTLKGNPITLDGTFPKVGEKAPAFSLVNRDLEDVTLANYAGKKKSIKHCPKLGHPYLRYFYTQI